MKQRLYLNAILLAVVSVLGLFLYFSPGKVDDQEPPLLIDLSKDSVDRIRIEHDGEPVISLKRQGQTWHLLEPYQVAADSDRISLLLDFLQARSVTRFPSASENLASYGLDHPGSVLTINDQRFEFGAQHPLKAARYVQFGDTVHLVADIVTQHLTAGAEAYVNPNLIEPGSKITGIEVPGLKVSQENNALTASDPSASTDEIAGYIERWRSARAIDIRRATDKDRSTVTTETVQIKDGFGKSLTFTVLTRTPTLQLLRPDMGLVYEVPIELSESLLQLKPAQAASP
ncbi:MAG: DUF4340 domain-containing protein [Gammaproteobacteria bacterium]